MDPEKPQETFWQESMRKGGNWVESRVSPAPRPRTAAVHPFPAPEREADGPDRFTLVAYPTIQFFDGRGANRPWLQEMPDPMTQITWGSWVEIHPETAARLGVAKGDLVLLSTDQDSLVVSVFPYPGIHPKALAMPIGQGHTNYGVFADGQPGNPVHLLPAARSRSPRSRVWNMGPMTGCMRPQTLLLGAWSPQDSRGAWVGRIR